MKVSPTALREVLLLKPAVHSDSRGMFFEAWRDETLRSAGIDPPFRQESVSVSRRGVLRGLHFQHPYGQGKLVTVLSGEVFDVAVDVRRGSPTFGRWAAETLSRANGHQLWIPPGFAHGFQALADDTVFLYSCTDIYHPEAEFTVRWDDPALGIPWPLADAILSDRDRGAPLLAQIMEKLPAASR